MPINPESLYLQLGQLVSEMPELGGRNALTQSDYMWIARVTELVRAGGDEWDFGHLRIASDGLTGPLRDLNAQQIKSIAYRTLANAEANAPIAAKGMFVGVGASFDALKAVGQVMSQAIADVLVIDAYMDSKVLTDFAPLVREGVSIRLLTDSFYTKLEALNPAVTRWTQQYGAVRPIAVRLTAPRALHDRLIIADGRLVWSLTQSLKDFAGRSPALVQRVDDDISKKKIEFYEQLWLQSTDLL